MPRRRRGEPAPDRLTAVLTPPPPAEVEALLDEDWAPVYPAPAAASTPPTDPGAQARRTPRVFTMPAGLAGAVTRPAWLAIIGVAVVCVVVAVIVGVRTVQAVASAAPTVVGPVSPSGSRGGTADGLVRRSSGPAAVTAGAGTTAPSAAVTAVVHVVGLVARPGVVRLPSGARVIDAVMAAGGTRRGADVSQVNLARPVTDGEQIVLPATGAPGGPAGSGTRGTPGTAAAGVPGGSRPGAGPPSGGNRAGAAAAGSGVVDLNAADAAALETLPGVGPVLAGRIVQWRTEHGRFTSVEELVEVPGIGEKLLERIRPAVRA